jgi:hypothetical protein
MGEDQPLRPVIEHGLEVRCIMDTHKERQNEIRTEDLNVYEPPMLEEVGEFATLTHADSAGTVVEGSGYYPG